MRRVMAPARDGEQVPVSMLLPRKRSPRTAPGRSCSTPTAPTAPPRSPTSTPSVLSLVDRGFVYAIAHIRGGQEMGRRWYDDGKMMKKKNTFNDFIDVAEYLVRERLHLARAAGRERRRAPAGC